MEEAFVSQDIKYEFKKGSVGVTSRQDRKAMLKEKNIRRF
jgi:hypothetical protein